MPQFCHLLPERSFGHLETIEVGKQVARIGHGLPRFVVIGQQGRDKQEICRSHGADQDQQRYDATLPGRHGRSHSTRLWVIAAERVNRSAPSR